MPKVVRIQSFDSMTHAASRKTVDTILSNVTDAELAAYMASRAKMNPGKLWDGYFKPLLQAMDKKARDEVMGEMTNYGNELAQSKAISETAASGLIFGGQNDDGEEVEAQQIIEGNPTQDNIGCNSRGGGQLRKWRDQNSNAVAAMQKANAEFWKR